MQIIHNKSQSQELDNVLFVVNVVVRINKCLYNNGAKQTIRQGRKTNVASFDGGWLGFQMLLSPIKCMCFSELHNNILNQGENV